MTSVNEMNAVTRERKRVEEKVSKLEVIHNDKGITHVPLSKVLQIIKNVQN